MLPAENEAVAQTSNIDWALSRIVRPIMAFPSRLTNPDIRNGLKYGPAKIVEEHCPLRRGLRGFAQMRIILGPKSSRMQCGPSQGGIDRQTMHAAADRASRSPNAKHVDETRTTVCPGQFDEGQESRKLACWACANGLEGCTFVREALDKIAFKQGRWGSGRCPRRRHMPILWWKNHVTNQTR